MVEGGKEAIRVNEEVVGSSEVKVLEKRIRELERVLGKKPGEQDFREDVKVAHEKNSLALSVIARRGLPVKRVADTLDVSRSQLHSRLREGSRPRGRYQKSEDAVILASIRTLTDDRPTYGYRRIWALLNRQRESTGLSRLNRKRIYRLDVAEWPLAAALHRKAARSCPRRPDHHDPIQPAMDLGWLRGCLLGWCDRSHRLALDPLICVDSTYSRLPVLHRLFAPH